LEVDIHSTAVIDPDAYVGKHVVIGPYAIVEAGAVVSDGCQIAGRVTVKRDTVLGSNNQVFEGAVLGGLPQHIDVGDTVGRLIIGSSNQIRENVTIHRGLRSKDVTLIGDQNMIMVNVHIAHDCRIGNQVVIINNAMIAGHVTIEDRAYLAGGAAVQQFRRIGKVATVGGYGRMVKDVPPFVTVDGNTGGIVGLNVIGLRRAGYTRTDIQQMKDAYRLIYRAGLSWDEVMERLPQEFSDGPAADFHHFFSTGGQYGFVPERRIPSAATVKLYQPGDDQELRKAG
jgi:UDP-N-acetylglucosamine acyltransferase